MPKVIFAVLFKLIFCKESEGWGNCGKKSYVSKKIGLYTRKRFRVWKNVRLAYNGITAFLGLFPFTCNWFKKGRAWGLRLNIGMIFSLKAKVKFEKRLPVKEKEKHSFISLRKNGWGEPGFFCLPIVHHVHYVSRALSSHTRLYANRKGAPSEPRVSFIKKREMDSSRKAATVSTLARKPGDQIETRLFRFDYKST